MDNMHTIGIISSPGFPLPIQTAKYEQYKNKKKSCMNNYSPMTYTDNQKINAHVILLN